MSRIGKLPVNIPNGVKVEIAGNVITATGPLGTLNLTIDSRIAVEQKENELLLTRSNDNKLDKSMHGLYRALLNNMVIGVSQGYKKTLIIAGVGYRATVNGNKLTMSLGFSHPVEVIAPEGIKFETKDANTIIVSGINKELVGEVAAKIRALRPVEPYHLYGVHYDTEKLTKKEGKKAGSGKK